MVHISKVAEWESIRCESFDKRMDMIITEK